MVFFHISYLTLTKIIKNLSSYFLPSIFETLMEANFDFHQAIGIHFQKFSISKAWIQQIESHKSHKIAYHINSCCFFDHKIREKSR